MVYLMCATSPNTVHTLRNNISPPFYWSENPFGSADGKSGASTAGDMLRNPAGLSVCAETLLFYYSNIELAKCSSFREHEKIALKISLVLSPFWNVFIMSHDVKSHRKFTMISVTRMSSSKCWSLTGWKFIVNFSLHIGTGRCKWKLHLQFFSSVVH